LIQYLSASVDYYGRNQNCVFFAGRREGLRVVDAKIDGSEVVLDVLSPNASDPVRVFTEQETAEILGYKGRTKIYVEVVVLGEWLQHLDAKDFVCIVDHDFQRKAVFASVRA